MKTYYPALLFFFLVVINTNAQTLVNKIWEDTTGHPILTYQFQAAKLDGSGNVYIAGNTYRLGEQENLLLTKYSTAGTKLWQKEYNSPAGYADILTDLYIKGNYYYATGMYWDSANAKAWAVTLKGNATTGDTVWTRTYNGSYGGYDAGGTIKVDNSGNVYIGGMDQQSATNFRMLAIKYDSTGLQKWVSYYDSAGFYDGGVGMLITSRVGVVGFSGSGFGNWDFVTASFNSTTGALATSTRSANANGAFSQPCGIVTDYNDNIYIAGTAAVGGINTDIKIIKYDTLLNQQWLNKWGSADSLKDEAAALSQDIYANLLVTGFTTKANGAKDLLVLKYNTGGSLLWSRTISAPDPDKHCTGSDIVADDSLNVYVTGTVNNGNDNDFITVCYDKNGNVKWQKTYAGGAGKDDKAYDVVVDSSHNVYVSGSSASGSAQYVTLCYQQWERATTFALDTDTIPIFAKHNIIVRFDTSALKLDVINNEDIVYGGLETFFKDDFIDSLDKYLPDDVLRGAHFVKLAPQYHTWDTTRISNIGDTVYIPPFWSSFLMVYSTGDSTEKQYCDSFMLLSPLVRWAHLNNVMLLQTCDCSTACPTDPSYDTYQFGLHDDAQYLDGDINVEQAWGLETGKPFVKIGVFDTGIRFDHEDFDADGQTIVSGKDYTTGATGTASQSFPDIIQYPATGLEPDFDGHGTEVSGVIGALRNNGVGIAGVAGGRFCTDINYPSKQTGVLLQAFRTAIPYSPLPIFLVEDVIKGMHDLIDNHHETPITNHSYGGYMNEPKLLELKELFHMSFRLGKITIAARGNSQNLIHNEAILPACFNDDWIINVAGSTTDGSLTTSSCKNDGVDVLAPYDASLNYTTGKNNPNTYTNVAGTSFSAPYVSGLSGLLLSYLNNPTNLYDPANLAPEDVEEIIQRTAWNFYTNPASAYDPDFGWGRIDAGAALDMVDKNKSRLIHRGNYNATIVSSTLTNITGGNPITLIIPETTNQVTAGTYTADVWELTEEVDVNFTLGTNETIEGFWARSSSSNCFPLYDVIGGNNVLDPYFKCYLDAVDPSTAILRGYYYHLTDAHSNTSWLPANPSTNAGAINFRKMSYTIYTRSSTPLAVNEITADFTASVYPNPAANTFHLSVKTETAQHFTIRLFNNLGQLINILYTGNTREISEDINTSKLSNGVYLVQVESPSTNKLLKLVIQK